MYATVYQIKEYLNVLSSVDDELLEQLLLRATASIEAYTGRVFEVAADSTRYLDAAGRHINGRTLHLDDDLCSITTITNGDAVEVASNEYVTQPRNNTPYNAITLLASSGKHWTYSTDYEAAIAITGRWGYSVTPADDVVQAVLRWAGYLYRQRDAQIFDVTAIPDAGVIQIPQGMPADVRVLLEHYRRLS